MEIPDAPGSVMAILLLLIIFRTTLNKLNTNTEEQVPVDHFPDQRVFAALFFLFIREDCIIHHDHFPSSHHLSLCGPPAG